jgi:hypothetical protein
MLACARGGTVIIRMHLILAGGAFDTPVQFQKVLIQNHTCIQQRHQGMRQNVIHLDHRPDNTVKTAVLHSLGQANAKDLQ